MTSSATTAPAHPEITDSPEVSSRRVQASRSGVGRIREDLQRFGPNTTASPLALDEAFAYCRNLANLHYENFTVASRFVPARIRPHLCSIYAYCRWSDDLADEMEDPAQARELLGWWRSQVDACFAGHATHPVFIALRQTIGQFDLEPKPFTDLLSAFLQDQSQTRYESDAELLTYCERSANPVGRLVMKLASVTAPEALAWSDSICSGLQLANFCQDVRLDAERGRVYWPADRLRREGVDPANLCNPIPTDSAKQGLMQWAAEARRSLVAGLPLVQHGPLWFARSVQLFVRGGLTILQNIDLQRGDVWTRPLTVSKGQKLRLMAGSILFPRSTSVSPIHQPQTEA
ncbi:MAG: squalene synthase HpnC [Planctomycetota bacterium]